MIRDIFVVNRDKKITIHDKKITNRDFFLSLGIALHFQIENRKIERGIAEMPFPPFFCRKYLIYTRGIWNRFLVISLDGWRIGQ